MADFLLQLYLCSRFKTKGTKLFNDSVIHINPNWTFLRKTTMKCQTALFYTNRKREKWKGNMGYCSRYHIESSFCFIIWHSQMMLPLFHSKSLTGKRSDTHILKSVGGLTSVSVRVGIKLKPIVEVTQWASKSSQWLLSKTNHLLGRKDELMCTAESSWRQTSWRAKTSLAEMQPTGIPLTFQGMKWS